MNRLPGANLNQSRTNGPINAHLTIAQVMPKYNHNNEKQEALLKKFHQNICSSTAINSTTKLFVNAINMYCHVLNCDSNAKCLWTV